LVLAIGIVVDNAIVVIEAVHAKMEKSNISPLKATDEAMKEISGAIVAITLVMSAVFVPVAFMSGPTGIFYRQFSLTMAVSIVLSGIVALTLTPALCAIILKNSHGQPKKYSRMNRLFNGFNHWYENLSQRYQQLLNAIASRRAVTIGILLIFLVGSGVLGKLLSFGFIPNEDQGTFYASVTTPVGATLERTSAVVDEIEKAARDMKFTASVSTLAGFNLLTDGTGSTYGMCMINLKPWEERSESIEDAIKVLREKTKHIQDAQIEFFPPPAVPGYGNASGFELRLLDKSKSDDLTQLEKVADDFVAALNSRPEIQNAFTSFDASFPQYLIHIDNDKAAQKGVTTQTALENLQTLIGSYYATNFIRFGRLYKVMVQALPEYRSRPDDLLKLYVENSEGETVPYSAFITIEKVFGPEQLTRYNMYTSAMLNGENAPGYSSGDAINAIQEVARETLPRGFGIDWAGISRDEVLAGNQAVYIFIICLVFVYLLLSAQYESFLLPLPVILSLPTGVFGALFLLMLMGLENNIYAQVAMIMLIGLLGKNAILIVEFASMKHREGLTPLKAAIEGATVRLRPILMTSFAFIAGLIPLMFASGAGAIGNRTIGTAAAGGMLFGTVFGVIIIPGLYFIFATVSEKHIPKGLHEEVPFTEELKLK
jgi:HAE1 family hydrophobic/amphiphilic exporter-1